VVRPKCLRRYPLVGNLVGSSNGINEGLSRNRCTPKTWALGEQLAETTTKSDSVDRRPRFIVDAPATQDELGAHGRLAAAIVEVVRNDHRIKTMACLAAGEAASLQLCA